MLNVKEIQKEYAKSYIDKTRIYFIEHYLSTMDGENGMQPLKLFPRQKEFLKSLSEHKETIAIKHRQAGITTITSAWASGQIVFAPKDTPETILCIGNKLDLSQQLVEKIRNFLEQIPRWFWGDEYFSFDPKSEKNKKSIFLKCSKSELELFNGCKVYARSSGPNAARGISSVSLLVFDEAAFIENGMSVYAAAVAATSARKNRKIVMISTPNGKDALYYNTYSQALTKENNYNPVEFKWYQDLRYNKFLKWYKKNGETGEYEWIEEELLDDTGTVPYDEERWRDLVKKGWTPTSPWYISMSKAFNNDSIMIAQELDGSFMGSANNVIAPEYIEMQETMNVREPLQDLKDPLVEETWFWKPPIEGHRYICCCLPEGEKVLTDRGLVSVEEVTLDDKLVNCNGEYTKIKRKIIRDVKNEKIIKIKLSNNPNCISFTYNHPILSSVNTKIKRKHGEKRFWDFDFKYHNAEEINIGDWVQMPNMYQRELSENEILDKWKPYENIGRNDFRIKNPLTNEDFWWYCGLWLAEGWIMGDKTSMTCYTAHNIKETDIIEKAQKIIFNLFDRKGYKRDKIECNSCTIYFNSKQICNFLVDTFGKYAKFKMISEWIKFLPKKYKIQLLNGYMCGDGYIHKSQKYCGFTSISLSLLKSIQDILYSLGILSNLKLIKKEGFTNIAINGKIKKSYCQNKYEITLPHYDTKLLLDYFGIKNDIILHNRRIIKENFYSEDNNTIFFRIKFKEEMLYSGKVYNFEVEDDSHTFCCNNIVTHNCDPSRGTSEDRTAIEIIDIDGRDENGLPIVEQVMEYLGKKLGDDIGGMMVQYATMYNNAYCVLDATGGQADAAIITMMQLGYKNFYYEDNNQKSYMIQNASKSLSTTNLDRLPGFHFQGNRYPVLANFATMVRSNEFKIRSLRVIKELETWIFKGEAQRIDHMDGMHDDTLTCLAMGLFVMIYSFNKLDSTKQKDAAILKAYIFNENKPYNRYASDSVNMRPKNDYHMPFYGSENKKRFPTQVQGDYLWVFGKMY